MSLKKYLTLFGKNSEYTEFYGKTEKGYVYPNASYTTDDKDVFYEPFAKKYVTAITLNETAISLMNIGDEATLSVESILPIDADDKEIVWKVNGDRIVDFDSSTGKITAKVKSGVARIQAMAKDNSHTYAACTVKIQYVPVQSISLNKTELKLKMGVSEKLIATINPSDASNKKVIWESSDPTVATVDQEGNVTVVSLEGSCEIRAISDDNGKTAVCHFECDYTPVTGITIDETGVTIDSGDKECHSLTVHVLPEEAVQLVTYTSSNSAITVDNDGCIKANAVSGDATITVTTVDKGLTATVPVHIHHVPVTAVTLNYEYLSLDHDYDFGESGRTDYVLTATVLPEDATNKNILKWTQGGVVRGITSKDKLRTRVYINEVGTGSLTVWTDEVNPATGQPFKATCEIKRKKDYSTQYFTLRQISGGTGSVDWGCNGSVPGAMYSLDSGATWQNAVGPSGSAASIPVSGAGTTLMLKRDYVNNPSGTYDSWGFGRSAHIYLNAGSTNKFVAEGNIMSLVYGDNFIGKDDFPEHASGNTSMFWCLFEGFSGLTSADDMVFPATKIPTATYSSMFSKCINLKSVPNFPTVTEGGSGCFSGMFAGCTSIKTIMKDIVVTPMVLSEPYSGWYEYATATTQNMFNGCTGLTNADINVGSESVPLTNYACRDMFNGCTSLRVAPKLPATGFTYHENEGNKAQYSGMFAGCTSLETAPDLPLTELTTSTYNNMFSGCTSLKTAPNIAATTLRSDTSGHCYNMFAGCTSLETAPELKADTLGNSSYYGMFSGCTSLKTAPNIAATTLRSSTTAHCRNMFAGCTSLETAPELKADTLRGSSYRGMFSGCTSLKEITCLATNISASYCTTDWVNGVAASGTFTKAASMSSWTTGVNGIPSGWDVQDAS